MGVEGSNPFKSTRKETAFVYQTKAVSFQRNKSLPGFVKFASQVKYAAACEGFISFLFPSKRKISANIREAQYAHGKADFIAKLQIALKEANETGYWLELLYKTSYISEEVYKQMDSNCTSIRVMLIASIRTAKGEPSSSPQNG